MKTTLYLLVLTVAFTAGIHAALAPEHLQEMPPLGVAFIAAAAAGLVLAGVLLVVPRPWVVPLAGAFLACEIVAWVAFVTVPVPGFEGTPEPIEAIAVVCKAIEAVGLLLSIRLIAAGGRLRSGSEVARAAV